MTVNAPYRSFRPPHVVCISLTVSALITLIIYFWGDRKKRCLLTLVDEILRY